MNVSILGRFKNFLIHCLYLVIDDIPDPNPRYTMLPLKTFIHYGRVVIKHYNLLFLLCVASMVASCGGGGGGSPPPEGDADTTVDVTGLLDLPFDYSFGVDNKIYFPVRTESFQAEFSAWGSTAFGHTGHVEGDGKSNYSVYIQPSSGMIEFTNYGGNDDVTCDAGETCGVTAATAISNAPWYKIPHDDMELIAANYDFNAPLGGHVSGEGKTWSLTFRYGNHNLSLGHVGELSATLEAAMVARFGSEVSSPTTSLSYDSQLYNDPIPMSRGTVVARPQVTFSINETEGSEQLYYAHAQVEWGWLRDNVSYAYAGCGYAPLLPAVKTSLQSALEAALLDPVPYGRFLSYQNNPPVEPAVAAHSVICANPAIRNDNFSRLSVTDSRSWIDNLMDYPTLNEVFTVFPVETGTSVYTGLGVGVGAGLPLYDDADVHFMMYRGHQDGSSYFRLQDSLANNYDIRAMWTQVLTMNPGDDTATSASFVARIEPYGLNYDPATNYPADKFVAVSYRLFSDRLVTHWGTLEDSEAAALSNVPAPIPDTVTCDGNPGNPYFCYDHDFTTLF